MLSSLDAQAGWCLIHLPCLDQQVIAHPVFPGFLGCSHLDIYKSVISGFSNRCKCIYIYIIYTIYIYIYYMSSSVLFARTFFFASSLSGSILVASILVPISGPRAATRHPLSHRRTISVIARCGWCDLLPAQGQRRPRPVSTPETERPAGCGLRTRENVSCQRGGLEKKGELGYKDVRRVMNMT